MCPSFSSSQSAGGTVYYDVCIYFAGPKRPIVRDIVLTNLYITAALGLYIHGLNHDKRRNCPDKNGWQLQGIYTR